MQHRAQDLLMEAAKSALGEWAFLFWDSGDGPVVTDVPFIETFLLFSTGDEKYRLTLLVPKSWIKVLTSSVVGEESDQVSEDSESVGELLNIVLGKFLSSAFPMGKRFERSVPISCEVTLVRWKQLETSGAKILSVEGVPTLWFFQEENK
jgi:hypothetical protein